MNGAKKDYSVNITIQFTPPHDSACSWNKHPTAYLWFLMMYCTHCCPTGCLAARVALVCDVSAGFSLAVYSLSHKCYSVPSLVLILDIYFVFTVLLFHIKKWQCWLVSYQDVLHYILYVKHYWAAQKEGSKALNMHMQISFGLFLLDSVANC